MNPGARGKFRYDYAVYDDEGRLVALLEAKRQFGTDPSWARAWHAMMAERMDRPADVNVVLVAPDHIYAWRPGADASANPDWTFDAGPWFAPYFKRLKIPAREVAPSVFEAIVGLWLRDVVEGELPEGSDVGGARDLLEALRGGEVVQQVAA
jgi:hypothetical protein